MRWYYPVGGIVGCAIAAISFGVATGIFSDDIRRPQDLNLTLVFNRADDFSKTLQEGPLHISNHWIEGKRVNNLHFHDATWNNIHLKNSEFRSVHFDDMLLEKATLEQVDFLDSKLSKTKFKDVVIRSKTENRFDFPRDFHGASMQQVVFENSVLNNIDFRGMPYAEIHFINSDLENVSFSGSKVKLIFENTTARGVDLNTLQADSEYICYDSPEIGCEAT
jgi:uncharacterized protein YjbI with pentapeptide repeats